jgi:hypothetical protein
VLLTSRRSQFVQRCRESPGRTLGVIAVVCLATVVEYFPQILPWWASVGVMSAAVVTLVVLGWPLLSIGKSGREAIAHRERELRYAEANPLAVVRRRNDRSADD